MRTFWVEPITYVSVDSPEAWEEQKRYAELQAERKRKYLEGLPPAERERLRKLNDFRPETCERCCQLAWESAWEQHVWSEFAPPPPRNPKSVEEVKKWHQECLARDHPHMMAYHRHLVHERHIFALLLPPSVEGVKQGCLT